MMALKTRGRAPGLFRALADATRLRILHLLKDGELCVCDLMSILRVPQAKTSRHLAYLRRAGLVKVREAGLWCYYSLAPAEGPLHQRLVACLDVCCDELPVVRADSKRARGLRKGAACCPP
jgi:ArsR family transcriptional regulator